MTPSIVQTPGIDPSSSAPAHPFALAKMLRVAGAALVLSAAATFLLQRWSHGNDVYRYGLLLGQTLLLVMAAFVCGVRIRESRGSRTFFALVVASLPIHFAVLGGLLYSQLALDAVPASLPSQAIWVAPSKLMAVLAVLVGTAVLAPVTLMALVALARAEAWRLLGLLFLSNALLLVPVRHPSAIAIGFAAVAVALLAFELTVVRTKVALRTPEGRLLRALLVAPPLLAVARAVCLYEPNAFFTGCVGLTAGIATFAFASRLDHLPRIAGLTRTVGTGLASVGWLAMAGEIGRTFRIPEALALPLAVLPLSALLVALSVYAGAAGSRYRAAARFIAAVAVTWNLGMHIGVGPALLVLVVGLILLAVGVYRQGLLDTSLGALVSLVGLAVTVHQALGTRFLGWGSLTVVGMGLLFVAAGIERNPERFSRWVTGWSRRGDVRSGGVR